MLKKPHLLLGSVKDNGDEGAVVLVRASRTGEEMHLRALTRFLFDLFLVDILLHFIPVMVFNIVDQVFGGVADILLHKGLPCQ